MSETNNAEKDKVVKTPKKKNKKRQRKIKKAVIIILLVLAAVFVFFIWPRISKKTDAGVSVYVGDIYTATVQNVEKTVSATGLVESHEDTTAKVYSTLNYKVDTINVKLGDKVEKGDVICLYDTETIDRMIREKELSMSSAQRTASLNLANARNTYESYKNGMNSGTNSAIVNAQSAYDTAVDNYDKAKEDYDDYLAKSDSDEIVALRAAKRDRDKAQEDYDNYLAELENDENSELNIAKRERDKAQQDYDDFLYKLENDENTALSIAKRALDKAQKDYDDLKAEIDNGTNLELAAAKRSMDTARENYEDYKEMVDEDETAELMGAAAALDKADDEYDKAVALRNQYKRDMDAALDEWEAIKDDPEASDLDKSKAENKYNTAVGKYNSQCTVVSRLGEQRSIYEDAYDKAYDAADITLRNYKTAYDNAVDNYNAVKKRLDDQLATYEKVLGDARDNYEAAKSNADTQLATYKTALDRANDNYEAAKENADTKLTNYKIALDRANDNYDTAKENADNQLKAYEDALTRAERARDDAKIALDNAKTASGDQLESYRIAYETALNNTDTSLADYQLTNLYVDREKTSVEAPISGTVTAIYAVEGETLMTGGVMFVIEDTENLVISSTVKAYDLGKVSVGMPVNIKTDSTGDTVFKGIVESIAPTALKDAAGSVISTNDAEFETVVKVLDTSGALRIGVSAKIEYVVEAAENAVTIPESALLTDGDVYYVIVGEKSGDNAVKLTRCDVMPGVSDGIYISVTGIDAGASVIDNASNYMSLIGKTVPVSKSDNTTRNNGMADMMAMSPMAR